MCWGRDDLGQLGDGRTTGEPVPTPVEVTDLRGLSQVAAGQTFTCGLIDTRVHCWGANLMGQLGRMRGTLSAPPDRGVGGLVARLVDVAEIEAGLDFTCARRNDGTVSCWGSDEFGQLGDGTETPRHAFCGVGRCSWNIVEVSGISTAIDIAAGSEHACALLSSGEVWCWGRNHFGQLGDGTLMDSDIPVQVRSL
jgi:alpha-tubulin suppressor-like RCC1 family protein